MAATTIGPIKRPQSFIGRALLQQEFSLVIENKK
jgi:hypothetical protein